jgi:integrase
MIGAANGRKRRREMGAEKGLFQRGGTWYISYFHNGKHIRKAIGTKGEARKELTAIRGKIDGRTYIPPREDSFDGLVDDYEAIQKEKAGYASEQYYIARVREYFKGRNVQDIAVEDAERFMAYLEALPKNGGGKRSGTDINHYMRVLYSVLKRAVLRDWIAKNPADPERVKRPEKGNVRTQYFKVEEAGRLLDSCTPHLYSIVLCGLEAGMRPAEVKGLRWSELGRVTLKDGSTAPMIFLPAEWTKTRQARKVPVSVRLAAHLDALREAQRPPRSATLSERVVSRSDLVFRFPKVRKALKKDARRPHLVTGAIRDVRNAWAAALEKAGLDPGLHLHDLRRTFRTHMKEAGVDSFTLNEIMGHANPKIEKTYTNLSDDHLVRAIAHIPDWNSHKTSTSVYGRKRAAC